MAMEMKLPKLTRAKKSVKKSMEEGTGSPSNPYIEAGKKLAGDVYDYMTEPEDTTARDAAEADRKAREEEDAALDKEIYGDPEAEEAPVAKKRYRLKSSVGSSEEEPVASNDLTKKILRTMGMPK